MRPIPIETIPVVAIISEDYFADMSVQMFSYNFLGFPEWWGS